MANAHGDYIWYELMTDQPDAAGAFYGAVIGWDIGEKPDGDMDYRMLSAQAGPVAGMMALTPEMTAEGARPCWMGYIGVDDVDAAAAAIVAAGGTIHIPPSDIPDVGRFAFVADPQGVMFYIMRGLSDETSLSFSEDLPRVGHCAWNELSTTDQTGALDFYTSQFGWKPDGDMDMGPMGKYQFLRAGKDGGSVIGAMMTKPAEMPVAMWTYYFRVDDIDTAAGRVTANGGQIFFGPSEVPGGDWIINGMDPQGAMFALVGAKS